MTLTAPSHAQCRAKDPATCRHHGNPLEATTAPLTAEGMFQSYIQTRPKADGTKSAVGSAIQSNLQWDGAKPDWWAEHEQSALDHKLIPTKPELLDVIDSPVGKLAVVWQQVSHSKTDKGVVLGSGMGLNVCSYRSFETGEEVGYVKMTYMDKESVERSFGNDEFTPYRWQDRWSGDTYPFNDDDENGKQGVYGDRDLKGEELKAKRREVWLAAQRHMGHGITDKNGKYFANYNLSRDNIPDDETVNKDLKMFSTRVRKEMKEKQGYWKVPNVDYSHVDDSIKGKGFGTALYVYTAKKLGTQGKVLRASGLQSDDAQATWGRFAKHFPDNITSVTLTNRGEKHKTPALDFRK